MNTLNLNRNEISDIDVFKNMKFNELNKLDLSNNKIDRSKNSKILENLRTKIKEFIIWNKNEFWLKNNLINLLKLLIDGFKK